MKSWTEKEFEKAVDLVKEGKGFMEISKIINRSWSSIKNKLNKSGIKYSEINPVIVTKKCKQCGSCFESKSFEGRKFCSNSCSAKYNNARREKKKFDKCLNCNKELSSSRKKYCNNRCQGDYKIKISFEKIKSGDTTLSSLAYKKYLIHEHGEKCMNCGWCEVNKFSGNVPVELEHKDGDSSNNSLDNLELLCPNCHSLTPTYKALNTGNGRHKRMERYKQGKSF